MTTKPKLGQNFLADPAAAVSIVSALGDISATEVLEIGPGKGAITQALASRAHRLIAIELDATLAGQLQQRYAANRSVEIRRQDILAVDLTELLPSPQAKLVIVGNLPYYITSQILLHLFDHFAAIDRAVLMLQREVADRIAAQPGSRDYGLLTATTQLYARVEKLFTLPPSAFSPPPEVYSTVVRLTFEPRFRQLGVDPEAFIPFLRQVFAQKRKTLANNLRFAGFAGAAIIEAMKEAKIPPGIRAEALPVEATAELFLRLRGEL